MNNRFRNIFMAFGIIAIVIMLCTMDMDYTDIWRYLKQAGIYFPLILALWLVVYMVNTLSWYLIINDEGKVKGLSFWRVYKLTVSGFALNYATPGGLMGGEPYKIMMLKPKIGTERATSSVILHTMTHIFSHFWFWLLSCALYILTQPMTTLMWILLPIIATFCLLAIWFFLKGYKRGITVWLMRLLSHFPLVKRWAQPFVERNAERLHEVDKQIAALHNQNQNTFVGAVILELACRIASALEIFFVLLVITPSANYLQCILILAFTSLFANLLFFIPLQLGGREGGFLMSAGGLGMTASAGIFVALIVRIRELVWTGIGLLMIKINRKTQEER